MAADQQHLRRLASALALEAIDQNQVRIAWAVVLARVVGDYVVIDQDTTDKPLVDALMINGGIPRERIILACAGETLPEPKTN